MDGPIWVIRDSSKARLARRACRHRWANLQPPDLAAVPARAVIGRRRSPRPAATIAARSSSAQRRSADNTREFVAVGVQAGKGAEVDHPPTVALRKVQTVSPLLKSHRVLQPPRMARFEPTIPTTGRGRCSVAHQLMLPRLQQIGASLKQEPRRSGVREIYTRSLYAPLRRRPRKPSPPSPESSNQAAAGRGTGEPRHKRFPGRTGFAPALRIWEAARSMAMARRSRVTHTHRRTQEVSQRHLVKLEASVESDRIGPT